MLGAGTGTCGIVLPEATKEKVVGVMRCRIEEL